MNHERTDRPWYEHAFDGGYLDRYAHRDAREAESQVAALLSRGFLRPGLLTLDLCCGAGRHLAQLGKHGISPIGLDLSASLLARASLAAPGRVVRGDMRRLPFRNRAFDAVLQMFTAFGYFPTDAENRAVLFEVARVLRPGGVYALDLMNRDRVVRHLVPESETTRSDGARIVETRRFDPRLGRVEKEIRTVLPSGGEELRRESVRVLTHREATSWLRRAGLSVLDVLGDERGSPYDEHSSPRMWIVARRTEMA